MADMPEHTTEDLDSAANGGVKLDKKAKAKARKQQQKLNKQLRRYIYRIVKTNRVVHAWSELCHAAL